MAPEWTFLSSGIVFGLSGGLTPGPLLTLVVSQTLRHGVWEGIKIAVAPLLTDLPIIVLTVFLISRVTDIQPLVGGIALLGSGFLAYLAYESLAFKGAEIDPSQAKPRSIRKGMIANFLNPSPYLFWFSVGAPTVLKGWEGGALSPALFLAGFYSMLVGSKILTAILVGKSRRFLQSRGYIYTVRFLGLLLLFFALLFLKESLEAFGVL
ncbi:MAG: LysE family translocator [Planctomycetota bacterium]|jgi:threonine/homoserine/homoserine lactone efflux protein